MKDRGEDNRKRGARADDLPTARLFRDRAPLRREILRRLDTAPFTASVHAKLNLERLPLSLVNYHLGVLVKDGLVLNAGTAPCPPAAPVPIYQSAARTTRGSHSLLAMTRASSSPSAGELARCKPRPNKELLRGLLGALRAKTILQPVVSIAASLTPASQRGQRRDLRVNLRQKPIVSLSSNWKPAL